MDTGFSVISSWSGPRGTSNYFTLADAVFVNGQYNSNHVINSLQSADTGMYSCSASLSPDPDSAYLLASGTVSEKDSIEVGKFTHTETLQYMHSGHSFTVYCSHLSNIHQDCFPLFQLVFDSSFLLVKSEMLASWISSGIYAQSVVLKNTKVAQKKAVLIFSCYYWFGTILPRRKSPAR